MQLDKYRRSESTCTLAHASTNRITRMLESHMGRIHVQQMQIELQRKINSYPYKCSTWDNMQCPMEFSNQHKDGYHALLTARLITWVFPTNHGRWQVSGYLQLQESHTVVPLDPKGSGYQLIKTIQLDLHQWSRMHAFHKTIGLMLEGTTRASLVIV